jgi:hypothetical protein
MRCSASLRPSASPPSAVQRSALQPPPSPSRSSRRWQNRAGQHQNRREDGGIKRASIKIDEDGRIEGASACA